MKRLTVPVGGGTAHCNPFEYLAWLMTGDETPRPIYFRKRDDPEGVWRFGEMRWSHWYDGVIAHVTEDDPDELIEHRLFLDMGDQLIPRVL